ncbi:MAG: HAD-IIB family hydrolase [Fervidicoccaceae archaeon]
MPKPTLIFTDVDRTLLGPRGELDSLRSLLEKLRLLGVPVIPVTSRTSGEVLLLMRSLPLGFVGRARVAVVESGGAILLSRELAWLSAKASRNPTLPSDFAEVPLARPLIEIDKLLDELLAEADCVDAIRFSKAEAREIARETGMKLEEAELAKTRRYDEALILKDPACRRRFRLLALKAGLEVLEGVKIIHVGSGIGKGRALAFLLRNLLLLEKKPLVVCLGDSEADRPMLESCDVSVLVPWPDGSYRADLKKAVYIKSPFPASLGWAWTLEKLVLPRIT